MSLKTFESRDVSLQNEQKVETPQASSGGIARNALRVSSSIMVGVD